MNLSLMYSNRAASQLKIGDLSGCVKDCTKSLELIPHSVKPLLRRAIAYEHLERYGSTIWPLMYAAILILHIFGIKLL